MTIKSTAAAIMAGIMAVAAPCAATMAHADEPHPGIRLRGTMNGVDVVPNIADTDGMGTVTLWVDAASGQLCHRIVVRRIGPVNALTLNRGNGNVEGPEMLTFANPAANGISEGCMAVSADDAAALTAQPAEHYVIVRTADFPRGSVRGQLRR